jgi:hypothetical protein
MPAFNGARITEVFRYEDGGWKPAHRTPTWKPASATDQIQTAPR